MSKRVEVREGDAWAMSPSGVLWQMRDAKMRAIASTQLSTGNWMSGTNETWTRVPPPFAEAVVNGFGGEWAEVAEEKPATTKTLYVYENGAGAVQMWTSKLQPHAEAAFGLHPTGTITIAGVTK